MHLDYNFLHEDSFPQQVVHKSHTTDSRPIFLTRDAVEYGTAVYVTD